MKPDIRTGISSTAFALRGYNLSNSGRSLELLKHPQYGTTVAKFLGEASQVCSDVLQEPVDLVADITFARPTTLETFGRDISLIVAMELAQLRLLEECFDTRFQEARLAFGYSLGEIACLAAGGVFSMRDLLLPLLSLSRDCAELARNVSMGVLFSRGPELDTAAVERLCTVINADGRGLMGISSYLAPNTVLLLGEVDTIDRFQTLMHDVLPEKVHLRKNAGRWPPLHTPILWQRNIPNRAAMLMTSVPGGFVAPRPTLLSLVTGKASYNDYNSRTLIHQWIDHPQRLWDVIYETLLAGITTVVHVGPAPNLIPATYKRLSDNVRVQLAGRTLNSLGLRAVSSVWRPWLGRLLSSRTALLRAPLVKHIILEDWLLEQSV